MEQDEYRKEEINWSYIEFIDNQDVLDLIEKVCFSLFQLDLDFRSCSVLISCPFSFCVLLNLQQPRMYQNFNMGF